MRVLSICTDLETFRAREELTEEARGKILNTGGTNIHYNGNQSMVHLSGLAGLEELAALPEITITSLEEIFGFTRHLVIDEEPQYDEEGDPIMENVSLVPEMRLLYDTVYPRDPIIVDGETYTPPLLIGIPGGYNTDHLTLSS